MRKLAIGIAMSGALALTGLIAPAASATTSPDLVFSDDTLTHGTAIVAGINHAAMMSDHFGRVPTNARSSSHHAERSGSTVAGRSVSVVPGVRWRLGVTG